MRRILHVREKVAAFARGSMEFLHPDNAKVLAYVRRLGDETVLVVANLSRFVQVVELDLAAYAGLVPEELFGHSTFPEIKQTLTAFTLGPHGFYWLALRPAPAIRAVEIAWTAPELGGPAAWSSTLVKRLEREVLPAYLPTCRWFGGKERVMRELKITQNVPLGADPEAAHLLIVEVTFADGLPDNYVLPLAFADELTTTRLLAEAPQSVVGRLEGGQSIGDALQLPETRATLLRLVAGQPSARSRTRVIGQPSPAFDPSTLEQTAANSRLLGADQSNASIAYGDAWFLKILRKFERGPHPDAEITRYLAGEAHLRDATPYGGSLLLTDPSGEATIGILVGFTKNQGDGWTYTLDALARYFDRVLEGRRELDETSATDFIGAVFPERARQLGIRTAELHRALASAADRPEFAPEPFSTLYQRSVYQGMRGGAGRVLRQLKRQLARLPEEARGDAASLLANHPQLMKIFARLLDHKIEATKIRIHGDFHLGQVLNTGKDFVIIDFEGEPRLPLSERRLKRSPLRDVAGMLRSFDYAVTTALRQERADDVQRLTPWARAWITRIHEAYLNAYFETVAGATFLPKTTSDTQLLLEAFQLEKAIYEIGYELSYRPHWVTTPLRAVNEMLARHGGSQFSKAVSVSANVSS
jgi:maltose alpha-D-glucosyltransferase/alpha-amylase